MSKLTKPQLVTLNAELSATNAQLRADVQRLTNQLEAERRLSAIEASVPQHNRTRPLRPATLLINGVARCSYFTTTDAFAAKRRINAAKPELRVFVQYDR